MKRWAFMGLLCWEALAYGQSVSTLIGARAAGMGNATSVLTDASSVFNNVGGMGWVKTSALVTAYEAAPSLPGANRAAAGLLVAFRSLAGGLSFFRFGDDVYNEQLASAGIANRFGNTSLGARIGYIQYQAQGFATKSTVAVSFGGLTQITPKLFVGAYALNLNQPRISEDQQLTTKLTAGLGFKPEDHFLVVTEVEKDLDYNPVWRVGAEYSIRKKIFIRTGFNLNPSCAFFGMGARVRRLELNYAVKLDPILRSFHQASATYALRGQTEK